MKRDVKQKFGIVKYIQFNIVLDIEGRDTQKPNKKTYKNEEEQRMDHFKINKQ